MRADRTAVRNIATLLAAQSVAALAGMFAFTRIGRELPVRELGRFGFALSSTAFFGLLAELGIRYAAMREIALRPEATWNIFKHASRARWLLALVSLLVLALAASLGAWRSERALLLLAGVLAVTQFGSDAATWVFFGRGRVDLGAAVLVIDRCLYVAAIHVAAGILPTAEGLVGAALMANLVRMMIALAWARSNFPSTEPREWEWPLFSTVIAGGAGIGVAVLASVAYSQVSVVLVKLVSAPDQLGYYAMAFGIVSVLLVIPTSVTMALFPTLAVRLAEGEEARRALVSGILRLNLCCALPLATVLVLFPDEVLAVWMGAQYLAASQTLRIMAAAVVLSSISFMYRLFLFATNRYRVETLVDVAAIIAVVGIGVPAIRSYGIAGLGLVFLLTEALVVTVKVFATRRWLGLPSLRKDIAPAVLAVLVPSILVSLGHGFSASVRLLVLVASVAALLVVLRVVPVELLQALRKTPAENGTASATERDL